MYDDKATLVTRLTSIRSALDKAREAVSYNSGKLQVQRNYEMLLAEEKQVLEKIDAIDAGGGGGTGGGCSNFVTFARPS